MPQLRLGALRATVAALARRTEAVLGRGEFNGDIEDAQVSQARRQAPSPGEQRQRGAIICFNGRAQPLDRRWASFHQRRAERCAGAPSLPVVGNGDRDVGGGRIAGVLQEMSDPDWHFLAVWRQHDKQERDVMHTVNAVEQAAGSSSHRAHRAPSGTGAGANPATAGGTPRAASRHP